MTTALTNLSSSSPAFFSESHNQRAEGSLLGNSFVNVKVESPSENKHKSTEIFKEKVSEYKKPSSEDKEKNYYVKEIVDQKGVTEEIAQAEYDFFS